MIKYKIGIDEVGRGPVAGPVAVGGVFYDIELENELMKKLEGMMDSKKLSEKKRENLFEEIKKLKSENYFDKNIHTHILKDIDMAENVEKNYTTIQLNSCITKKKNMCGDLKSFEIDERKNPSDFSAVEDQKKFNSKKVFSSVVFVSAKDIDKFGIVPSIQKALNSALENILKNEELRKINLDEIKILLDGGLKAPEKFKNQETIIKGDQKEFSISCASVVAKVIRDREMKKYGKTFPQYFFEKHKGYGTKKHMGAIKKNGVCELHRKTFLKNYL